MKCSLGISNFIEEISSLSHSVIFLYLFALIPLTLEPAVESDNLSDSTARSCQLLSCPSPAPQFSSTNIYCRLQVLGLPLMAQLVKNPPAMRETWVQSLGWEDPLEKGKATHSSILAWRIPWIV